MVVAQGFHTMSVLTEPYWGKSLQELQQEKGNAVGTNIYFTLHGELPEQNFRGEHHELVGLADLGDDVEAWILQNCER